MLRAIPVKRFDVQNHRPFYFRFVIGIRQFRNWHGEVKKAIQDSGLEWTFVQPASFFQKHLGYADAIKNQTAFYAPEDAPRRQMLDAKTPVWMVDAAMELLLKLITEILLLVGISRFLNHLLDCVGFTDFIKTD